MIGFSGLRIRALTEAQRRAISILISGKRPRCYELIEGSKVITGITDGRNDYSLNPLTLSFLLREGYLTERKEYPNKNVNCYFPNDKLSNASLEYGINPFNEIII